MFNYLVRRLLLLPLTLFCIILVNFIIINLAPGDPVTLTEVSQDGGASRREDQSMAFGTDDRYLQFREHYGLTLPILLNAWPWISLDHVKANLQSLVENPEEGGMSVKEHENLRLLFGDQARFVMRQLLTVIENPNTDREMQIVASRFFSRGATQQAFLGSRLSKEEKVFNRKIAKDNILVRTLQIQRSDTGAQVQEKVRQLRDWYYANKWQYNYEMSFKEKAWSFLFETRFCRYLSRVLTLDFGSLRNDPNKSVISEVLKRFKYSLTLAVIPMIITFVFCQIFGFLMALKHQKWPDYSLNVVFLILYAIPIFVVAPFLIEKVALHGTFPFTDVAIPLSGFTSRERVYDLMNSSERIFDVLKHIALPLLAIMYGGLAAQSRLSRTAVLEVLRQDYVRTARAKGLAQLSILVKHVGRNAAITIVTSLAGSLGIVLGGSLIVETMFGINGFGMFFYEAVINRDYNVIMFSALSGSFLTLMGYLLADIAYTVLDPRVNLE
jgi:peptide/nickel transport system permease protein